MVVPRMVIYAMAEVDLRKHIIPNTWQDVTEDKLPVAVLNEGSFECLVGAFMLAIALWMVSTGH